jgi:hypothetical protein
MTPIVAIGRGPRWVTKACLMVGCALWSTTVAAQAPPLAQLQFDIVGLRLVIDPPALTVPKQIATQLNTSLVLPAGAPTDASDAIASLVQGAIVEGTLRGPSIPPTRLTTRPGEPLLLPAFALPGDYFVDGLRLVKDGVPLLDATSQAGAPATTVPIKVINEVFVTSVTSRPLTLEEIKEKGIVIDQNNFQAVNFQVAFNIDGSPFTIQLPVAMPTRELLNTKPSRELLVQQLTVLNQQLATLQTTLPAEFDRPGLNFSIAALPFFPVLEEGDEPDFAVPPITGLVVIPGNVAFLNQFFSVVLMVSNVAPDGTSLVLRDVMGTIKLPTGLDHVAGVSFESPGDDPLRLARVEGVGQQATVKVVQLGPDGKGGTADDIANIPPQKGGEGEFLLEGLKEGGHIFDIEIAAVLDGLPSGPVNLIGQAAGAVFVRNPTFAVTLAHPRTIRSGEPYDIYATVTNTSRAVANLVSVNLDPLGISGAQLVSDPTVSFDTLAPGQAVTAKFRLIAQQTGEVTASSFTGEADGGIRLFTGVGERGVPLAPNAIVLPSSTDALPDTLVAAAQRVLGQAFSIATAPAEALPPEVLFVKRQTVIDRGLELAEAGQRIAFGDSLKTVAGDLLIDWLGSRVQDEGFDQLLRTTDAGRAFFAEVGVLLGPDFAADPFAAQGVLVQQALARSAPLTAIVRGPAGAAPAQLTITRDDGESAALDALAMARTAIVPMVTPGALSTLSVSIAPESSRYVIEAVSPDGGPLDFGISVPGESASESRRVRFDAVPLQPGGRVRVVVDLTAPSPFAAHVDRDGDGDVDVVVPGSIDTLVAEGLQVVSARQLESSFFAAPGDIRDPATYGLLVAVLFNKPTQEASVEQKTNYAVEANRVVGAAQQAGGRLVYLYLEKPVGGLVARSLTAHDIVDVTGAALPLTTQPIVMRLTDGARLVGQTREANGAGVPNSFLNLTIVHGALFSFTLATIQTDGQGGFDFDFVPRIGTVSLTAQHPQTRATASLSARVRGAGETLLLNPTFRGSGTVRGRVLASDGVTPVSPATVALLPGSILQLRGLQTNVNALGEFVFTDVPVGVFTLRAIDGRQASGQTTGVLNTAGETTQLDVVVLNEPETGGTLIGRVFLSDGETPAQDFQVFVGGYDRLNSRINAVDQTRTDATGSFAFATRLPENGYDVVAVDAATGQIGVTRATIVAQSTTAVSVVMESSGAVQGVVFNAGGQPVEGALVAGGVALVTTDANGAFRLEGVPAGKRTIEAGDPVTRRRGNTEVNVLPGQTVTASITLEARATITGRVLDANGTPIAKASVRIPQTGGFQFVIANNQGVFTFPDLPLGDYLLQAPGPSAESLISFLEANGYDPSVAFTSGDGPGTPPVPSSGDGNAVINAYQNAVRAFLTVDESLLGLPTADLGGFGFNKVRLFQDAVTQVADIRFLSQGTVSGRTVDSAGRPTGAAVRIRALKLTPSGAPSFGEIARTNSDAASGEFAFGGVPRFDLATFQTAGVRGGDFGLEAAQPFSPVIVQFHDQLNTANPDFANVVLQFPAAGQTNGTASGVVLMPDGVTPAPAGTTVKISFGDLTVTTDGNGRFVSALPIPAGSYVFTAQTPTGGLKGQASAVVPAGGQVNVTVRLLGLGSVLVQARRANGQPVTNATVRLRRGSFPFDQADGLTDGNGVRRFVNLTEGPFSVEVEEAITGLAGRASGVVATSLEATSVVTITASGRVTGTFLTAESSQPVPFAQVTLSGAVQAYATTDGAGRFELTAIPVGPFTVEATDPATGRRGRAQGSLAFEGQTVDVTVVQLPRGSVTGLVLNADGTTGVAAADVTLENASFVPTRLQVTTRDDGSFRIDGVSAGAFTLSAVDPFSGAQGTAAGSLSFEGEVVDRNVILEPFGAIRVTVLDETGQVAPNVRLTAAGREGAVDVNGQFTFEHLKMGRYEITGVSLADSFNGARVPATLDEANETVEVTLRLRGVAPVAVRVNTSNGLPVSSAKVTLQAEGSSGSEPTGPTAATLVGFTNGDGLVTFPSVPLGDYSARGEAAALSGLATGTTPGIGQLSQVTVTLGASGTVSGRVVLPDGVTPAARTFITLNFQSQSNLQSGVLQITTDLTGTFSFAGIPLGTFSVGAFEVVSSGVRNITGALATDGQIANLGDVILDNTGPRVLAVNPSAGASGVSPATTVVLTFSEPMLAPSFGAGVVSLMDGSTSVAGAIVLSPDRTSATFTPAQPLRSNGLYTVAVRGAPDGPRDESNLAMVDPFVSNFVVRDVVPPLVTTLSPAANAREVAPETVVRVTFSEPIAGGTLVLRNASGQIVPAQTAAAGGGTALVLSPVDFLPANGTFTVSVSGVTDLAGNPLAGGPASFTFFTVDTIAPLITALGVQGIARGGSTLTFTPTLTGEDIARIEYLAGDLAKTATVSPFSSSYFIPLDATEFAVSARAIDAVGNRSAAFALTVPIAANQPPTVQIVNLSGQVTVAQGAALQFDVTASDDTGLAQVLFSAVGAATASFTENISAAPSSVTRRFTVNVPVDATPGAPITIQAAAVDVGGSQSVPASLALTVRDGVPPAVTITAPAAGVLAIPGQTLTVTVTASDSGGLTAITLTCSPALSGCETRPIAPALTSTTQTFSVVVPASLNAPATVTLLARATDGTGNIGEAGRSIQIADVVNPTLTQLQPVSGSTRVLAGAMASLRADFLDNVGVVAVDFTSEGAVVANGSAAVSPASASGFKTFDIAVPANAANGATMTVRARARDAAGNISSELSITLTIGDTSPPAVSISQPAAGTSFAPGATITVVTTATDDVAVGRIVLRARGAVTFDEDRALAPPVNSAQATFVIPTLASTPAGTVTLTVQSFDTAGNGSGELSRDVVVRDATAPVVSIDTPASGATVDPRQPITVSVSATDLVGVAEVGLSSAGALVSSSVRPVSPAQPTRTESFELTFATAPISGGSLTLTGTARDAAGNQGTSAPVSVSVLDVVPPAVAGVAPANGATGVAADAVVTVTFSEPVAGATVTAASFKLLAGATPVNSVLTVAPDRRSATLTPSAALAINTVYTVVVDTSVTDPAGNALGAPFSSTFRTVSPDATAPKVQSTNPVDGAVGVGTAAPVSVTFTEAIAPASVTPATFRMSIGGAPIAGSFAFANSGATVTFTPASELPFDAVVLVELTGGITDVANNALVNADGSAITIPITLSYLTGNFALVSPGGTRVIENSPVTLEAKAAAALSVTSVVFSLNGVALPPVTAPFTRVITTPLASSSPTLTVVASARNASNAEIATSTRVYDVVSKLNASPSILGLGRSAAGVIRFTLAQPATEDLPITVSSLDPAVVTIGAANVVLPAGQSSIDVSVTACAACPGDPAPRVGAAIGNTSVIASSARGVAVAVVSVSDKVIGQTIDSLAQIAGFGIVLPPSAGQFVTIAGRQSVTFLTLLARPALADTPVTITSSNPAVATAVAASIAAGQIGTTITVTAVSNGVAVLTLRAGDTVRSFTIFVGTPPPDRTPIALAPIVGSAVSTAPLAGQVISTASNTFTTTVALLTSPNAGGPLTVSVISANPAVATATASAVQPGQQTTVLTITTGIEGSTLLTVRVGDVVRSVSVIVGTPAPDRTPVTLALPVGLSVTGLPFIGQAFAPLGSSVTLGLTLLAAPATQPVTVTVTSSDPTVAQPTTATVQIPIGSRVANIALSTGSSGSARLVLEFNGIRREFTVIVGFGPTPTSTAVISAAPVGLAIAGLPAVGRVIAPAGAPVSGILGVQLLTIPAASPVAVTVTSSDPLVATAAAGTIAAGDRVLPVSVSTTGTAGVAVLTFEFDGQRLQLLVVVGNPPASALPALSAPVIGLEVKP